MSETNSAGANRRAAPAGVLCLLLILAIVSGLGAAGSWAAPQGGPEMIPFDRANLIIEFNFTDEDVGIQALLDGEPWESVTISGPDRRKVIEIKGKGNVRILGLSELFFESEEPSLDELALEEFLDLFPEGEYHFLGKTVEGDVLSGVATFTHTIPDAPEILSPVEGVPVDPDDAVISWAPVADPPGSEIVGYQVTVEQEDPLRVFSVDLPASSTSVTVPFEFFDPLVSEYKVEVLSIEASGNQTISAREFETE